MQLEDLLEDYPNVFQSGLQTNISSKYEFNEIDSASNTILSKRGALFPHQTFYSRYLREYDNLCILDQPGTGKTCSVFGFTEWVYQTITKARHNPRKADPKLSHLKKTVVLVKNNTLLNEIKKQLVCKCSNGHYEYSATNQGSKEPTQIALNKLISSAGYNITTYRKFAKKVFEKYPEEKGDKSLIRDFSNTIFWVDEAHSILSDKIDDEENVVVVTKTGTILADKKLVYSQLYRIFHNAINCKRILSTATPMINGTSIFASLMNLLISENGKLPLGFDHKLTNSNDAKILFNMNKERLHSLSSKEAGIHYQGQFPDNYNFNDKTIDDIEPRIRGLIGFVRAANTGVVSKNIGKMYEYTVTPKDDVTRTIKQILSISEMSEFQSINYLKSKSSNDSIRQSERQASNFIFPDGSWGTKGFDKYFLWNEELKIYYPGRDFISNLKGKNNKETLEKIRKHSCKYAEIIEAIENMDNKKISVGEVSLPDRGVAFAYQEYIKGSGALVLAACLELMGYERYTGSETPFIKEEMSPNYCSSGATSIRKLKISPKKRYALLTEQTAKDFGRVSELINSYENRYGDYIRVLITSKVGREGISLSNCKQRHIVGPDWNESNMTQALERALRATSHTDKLQEIQQMYLQLGLDPTLATIEIETYKHAAVPRNEQIDITYDSDEETTDEDIDKPDETFEYQDSVGNILNYETRHLNIEESTDLYMYRYSSGKEIPIARLMKMLKRCSVNCQVNEKRNIKDTDIDNSPECHYDVCKYECYDNKYDEIDYTNYDLVYSEDNISQIESYLMNAFNQKSSFTIDEFKYMYSDEINMSNTLILRALEKIITDRMIMYNRTGFPCYVEESGGIFYLVKQLKNSSLMKYYVDNNVFSKKFNLTEIISENERLKKENIDFGIDINNYQEVKDFLLGINKNQPIELSSVNDDDNMQERISLIEMIISKYENKSGSSVINEIANKLLNCENLPIFAIDISEKFLVDFHTKNKEKKKGRGRPRKNEDNFNPIYIPYLNFKEEKYGAYIANDGPKRRIILHSLDSLIKKSNAEYNVINNYINASGTLRIFDPKEPSSDLNGWKNVEGIEKEIYLSLVQFLIQDRASKFGTELYYIISKNGLYTTIFSDTENKRKRIRGANCAYSPLSKIYEILYINKYPVSEYYNNYSLAELKKVANEMNDSEAQTYLRNPDNLEMAKFYLNLKRELNERDGAKISDKTYMCNSVLGPYFEEQGRIIDLNLGSCL